MNAYNLSGEYGIGYTNKRELFYFDLGYFFNFNQAVKARKEAEKKYFGGHNYET